MYQNIFLAFGINQEIQINISRNIVLTQFTLLVFTFFGRHPYQMPIVLCI